MRMVQRYKYGLAIMPAVLAWLVSCHLSYAIAQDTYTPDVAIFDGTNGYAFPASDAFDLGEGATVEFWVNCAWDVDPGYDPVILANTGVKGARYIIAVSGDRSGISLQAGDNLDSVPFDCKEDDIQHVAVAEFGDASAVMVNGRVIGTFDYGFSDEASIGFWIGTADGTQAPFEGVIAGLRLWDVALDRGDLVDYSVRDVFDADAPHPELYALLAHSDFDGDTIEIFTETFKPAPGATTGDPQP